MMTADNIRQVTFEKKMRGYCTEDVDAFLEQAALSVETLTNEKADLEKKLLILGKKVEEYSSEEETLKSALINAQRLGEKIVSDAHDKAETIERDAKSRAEDMLSVTVQQEEAEKDNLKKLEAQVAAFKKDVLGLYQQHVESLGELDRVIARTDGAVFGDKTAESGSADGGTEDETGAVVDRAQTIVDDYQDSKSGDGAQQ